MVNNTKDTFFNILKKGGNDFALKIFLALLFLCVLSLIAGR